jgi:ATP-dependent Clp protease ATP-binding subunit ClpA
MFVACLFASMQSSNLLAGASILRFFTAVQITQGEFTDMAWQAVLAAPDVAKENKHQIVETEHLMKALLEQRNGLARRIFSKAEADNTALLQATDRFIQRQPKVSHCPPDQQKVCASHVD